MMPVAMRIRPIKSATRKSGAGHFASTRNARREFETGNSRGKNRIPKREAMVGVMFRSFAIPAGRAESEFARSRYARLYVITQRATGGTNVNVQFLDASLQYIETSA